MIREFSINFKDGSIECHDPKNPLHSGSVMWGATMDELLYSFAQMEHIFNMSENKTLEQLGKEMLEGPCDRPDCHYHPWTYGKTQEEVDKESEERADRMMGYWTNPFKRYLKEEEE